MLHEASLAGVPVIRAGLQPTDDLVAGSAILAGPYHPAFRQLAEGERWYDLLKGLVAGFNSSDRLTIHVSPAKIADVVGQKRRNIIRLSGYYGRTVSGVVADVSLPEDEIRVSGSSLSVNGNILRQLSYRETIR
jgi:hypothetical protein